jgi:Cu/Ag efflux protein CusF
VIRLNSPLVFIVLLAAGLCLAGCHGHRGQADVKHFQIRGVVVSSDAKAGTVTLQAEIPGYMSSMAMPYTLKQPKMAAELHPGETITAKLTASPTEDVLDDVKVVGQPRAGSPAQ